MELRISGTTYDFFESFDITLDFSKIASQFSFTAFFNPDNPVHKQLFRPLKGTSIDILNNGEFIFTGQILNTRFKKAEKWEAVTISGYSKTGVLEDSNIPVSLYPLESNNLSLTDIAKKLVKPFGISVNVSSSAVAQAGKVFEKTVANESDSIKSYLSRLAQQRNLVLTHTTRGNLLITKANTGQRPSWVYNPDDDKVRSVTASVNGQGMHSEITSILQSGIESENAGQSKQNNVFVNSFRPKVVVQSSGDDNDSGDVAVNSILSELKKITFEIVYEDFIHRPNQIISIKEPFVYLYQDTRLFVESVNVKGDKEKTTSILNCVIPEVYSGSLPSKTIF